MPALIPEPEPTDRPFAETASVSLGSGEEVTLTYEPVSNDAMFRVGTVAVSKRETPSTWSGWTAKSCSGLRRFRRRTSTTSR